MSAEQRAAYKAKHSDKKKEEPKPKQELHSQYSSKANNTMTEKEKELYEFVKKTEVKPDVDKDENLTEHQKTFLNMVRSLKILRRVQQTSTPSQRSTSDVTTSRINQGGCSCSQNTSQANHNPTSTTKRTITLQQSSTSKIMKLMIDERDG